MITCALIASAVIALVLVVLVQGMWTSLDSWFAAVFASVIMAMVIVRQLHQSIGPKFYRQSLLFPDRRVAPRQP